MLNIVDILDRIQNELQLKNDAEIARLFKFHQSNLKNWRDRGTINWELLYDLCQKHGWSFDWLLTGRGRKKLQDKDILESEIPAEPILLIPPEIREIFESTDEALINSLIAHVHYLKSQATVLKQQKEGIEEIKSLLQKGAGIIPDERRQKGDWSSQSVEQDQQIDDALDKAMG